MNKQQLLERNAHHAFAACGIPLTNIEASRQSDWPLYITTKHPEGGATMGFITHVLRHWISEADRAFKFVINLKPAHFNNALKALEIDLTITQAEFDESLNDYIVTFVYKSTQRQVAFRRVVATMLD